MDVELLSSAGNDLAVVNAARVSFSKKSEELSERDKKLIHYLAKHGHWTPFAHTFISLRVKAPLFVARQLAKHQVGLVWNEVSRRYVDDEPEFWEPWDESWQTLTFRKASKDKKQGSSEEIVDPNKTIKTNFFCNGSDWSASQIYAFFTEQAADAYFDLLRLGVCPEQARTILPQSTYTEWIWSGNLYSFFNVYKKRTTPDAQKETSEVAEMIGEICSSLFPVSWEALCMTKDT